MLKCLKSCKFDKLCSDYFYHAVVAIDVILLSYVAAFIFDRNFIPDGIISHSTQSGWAASYSKFFGDIDYSTGTFLVVVCLAIFFGNFACNKKNCK